MGKSERQQFITGIVQSGQKPNIRQLAETFKVHANTIRNDVRAINVQSPVTEQVVSEMVGRSQVLGLDSLWRGLLPAVTVDRTQVDYKFYDELRRGKRAGYELGGLFAGPIAEITAGWVLGNGPKWVVSDVPLAQKEALETALSQFMQVNQALITQFVVDGYALGDSYLAVNPDESLSQIAPNQVEVITDDLDYRQVKAMKVTSRLEKAVITDEFGLDQRTITIQYNTQKTQPLALTFPNLLGRLALIHFANERGANEVYGHPLVEPLLKLFAEYDDVLSKALDGVKVMGNPVPVLEGMDDPAETLALNSNDTTEWTDANGNTGQRPVIDFTYLSMLVLGKGGSFKFAQPGPFTQDVGRLLEFLFLLMLQNSKIPEWAWGGAIASSKASVDAQMPAFTRYIESCRAKLAPVLLELARVYLAMVGLIDPRIGDVDTLALTMQWPELTNRDEKITQDWAKLARAEGALTRETLLEVAQLPGVEDTQAEVEAAQTETQAAQDTFEARVNAQLDNAPPDNPNDTNLEAVA